MRKAMAIFSFRGEAPRRIWAVICLASFLALQAVASSGTLHKWIHPDADSPDHECAVTMFLHGQVDSVATFVPLVTCVAALFFLLPLLESAVFSSFDYRFCPSRAPPRF
jgi:hypothetical protein